MEHEREFKQDAQERWLEEAMTKSLQENLTRQLCDSVENLQKQVEKVEFWASAVTGLTAPVPEYDPESTSVARYVKPGRPPRKRKRRRAVDQNERSEAEADPSQAKPASA